MDGLVLVRHSNLLPDLFHHVGMTASATTTLKKSCHQGVQEGRLMAMWLVGAIWGLLHWFLGPENPESSAFKLRPKDARRRTPAKVQALEGWHKFFGRSHEQRPESRLLWLPALCRSRWVSDFFGCHMSSDLGPEERFRSRCQKTLSTDQNSQCACRCGKRPLTSVRHCGAVRMNVRNAEGKTEQRVRLRAKNLVQLFR